MSGLLVILKRSNTTTDYWRLHPPPQKKVLLLYQSCFVSHHFFIIKLVWCIVAYQWRDMHDCIINMPPLFLNFVIYSLQRILEELQNLWQNNFDSFICRATVICHITQLLLKVFNSWSLVQLLTNTADTDRSSEIITILIMFIYFNICDFNSGQTFVLKFRLWSRSCCVLHSPHTCLFLTFPFL